jgi:excisionase family DNA binding protein
MKKLPYSIPAKYSPVTFDGRLALRIPEVAQALGVSETSVRRLIQRGHLKPLRLFRHVLIPTEQLTKLVGNTCTSNHVVGNANVPKATQPE